LRAVGRGGNGSPTCARRAGLRPGPSAIGRGINTAAADDSRQVCAIGGGGDEIPVIPDRSAVLRPVGPAVGRGPKAAVKWPAWMRDRGQPRAVGGSGDGTPLLSAVRGLGAIGTGGPRHRSHTA